MKNFIDEIAVVVFAAGKGTRIREICKDRPKAMLSLNKKPMCSYIIEKLIDIGFDKPNILVGYRAEQIINYFKNKCKYIYQKKLLGTGHAAKIVLKNISKKYKYLLIFQGDDSAFYRSKTIKKFILDFITKKPAISFMVTKSYDQTVGRVVEDESKNIVKIIEKENIKSDDFKKYKLINTAGYLFNILWMRNNISKLKKHYPKGEYYLPDLIKMAILQKKRVIGYKILSNEWFGINTPEQLQLANKLIKNL